MGNEYVDDYDDYLGGGDPLDNRWTGNPSTNRRNDRKDTRDKVDDDPAKD